MDVAVATFEGLPLGAVSAASAGFDYLASPSGGGVTVIATNPFRGTRCLQFLTGTAGGLCYGERTASVGSTSSTPLYGRMRMRVPALPPDATGVRLMVITDSSSSFRAEIRLTNAGALQLRNAAGTVLATAATTVIPDVWYDLGLAVTAWSTTVGRIEMRVWDTTSGAVVETLSSSANQNTTGAGGANKCHTGAIRSGINLYAVVVDDVDWALSAYPDLPGNLSTGTADGATASAGDADGTSAAGVSGMSSGTGQVATTAASTTEAVTTSAGSSRVAASGAVPATIGSSAAVTGGSMASGLGATVSTAAALAGVRVPASGLTGGDAEMLVGAELSAAGATASAGVVVGGYVGSGTVSAVIASVGSAGVRSAVSAAGAATSSAASGAVVAPVTVAAATVGAAEMTQVAAGAGAHGTLTAGMVEIAAVGDAGGGNLSVADLAVASAATAVGALLSVGDVADGGEQTPVVAAPHHVTDTTLAVAVGLTGMAVSVRRTR